MHSSESWRRLERLEEEQSAIIKETSRQKQETSRCLEQISNELVKTLLSQKALKKDCAQLQERIHHLEMQNEHLNKFIFRRYTPSSSSSSSLQTRHPTVKRNEAATSHTKVSQNLPLEDSTLQRIDQTGYRKSSQKAFCTPDKNLFTQEICEIIENYAAQDHIPEIVQANSTAPECPLTDDNHKGYHPQEQLINEKSVSECQPRKLKQEMTQPYANHKSREKNAQYWESETSSTITLQDEMQDFRNESTDSIFKTSLNRGSSFSLNDILDANIDELQLSIKNSETTEQASLQTALNFSSSCGSENSDYLIDAHALPDVKEGYGVTTNCMQNSSMEKCYRYSYPAALLAKHGASTEQLTTLNKEVVTNCAEGKTESSDKAENVLDKQEDLIVKLHEIDTFYNANKLETVNTKVLHNMKTQNRCEYNSEFNEDKSNLVFGAVTEFKHNKNDSTWQRDKEENVDCCLLYKQMHKQSSSLQLDVPSNTLVHEAIVNADNVQTSSLENFQELIYQSDATEKEKRTDFKECVAKLEQDLEHKDPLKVEPMKNWNETKVKKENKIQRAREQLDSLLMENNSKESEKDTGITKDKVTALTAYFEEVHAEQCPGCQSNNPKCRSLSSSYKSSTESKESASTDEDDINRGPTSTNEYEDDFQKSKHPNKTHSGIKLAENKVKHTMGTSMVSGHKKSLSNENLEQEQDTHCHETTEEQTNCIDENCKESKNTGMNYNKPVEDVSLACLQTDLYILKNEPRHTNCDSASTTLEQLSPQESKELNSQTTDNTTQSKGSEISNAFTVPSHSLNPSSGCLIDQQIQWRSLPSCLPSPTDSSQSPLHVSYVRTCSLKSFFDVVSPSSSPSLQKDQEESIHTNTDNKTPVAYESQCNELDNAGNKTIETEINESEYYQYNKPLQNNAGKMENHNITATDLKNQNISDSSRCEDPENHHLQQETALNKDHQELVLKRTNTAHPHNTQGRNHSELLTLSLNNIGVEAKEMPEMSILTKEDIRKYQLDGQIVSVDQSHLLSLPFNHHVIAPIEMERVEIIGKMDVRKSSTKPPIPPRRFHFSKNFIQEVCNPSLEIPDYKELESEANSFLNDNFTRQNTVYDNFSRSGVSKDNDRKAFQSHFGGSVHPVFRASQSNDPTFHINPQIQFRNYSKSRDGEKRNSYPDQRYQRHSQPEGQWQENSSEKTDLTWHYPLALGKSARPLSSYPVLEGPMHQQMYHQDFGKTYLARPLSPHSALDNLNHQRYFFPLSFTRTARSFDTSTHLQHGSRNEVSLKQYLAQRPKTYIEERRAKDTEDDLVFNEITKQIESLQQTVNELQNKKTDSN